jgi:capsular polysaccharide biosynthesis protein
VHGKANGLELVVHNPSLFSTIDSINLFQHACFISGLHGGGLANMMFVPSGTTVVEIMPKVWRAIPLGSALC